MQLNKVCLFYIVVVVVFVLFFGHLLKRLGLNYCTNNGKVILLTVSISEIIANQ